MTECPNCTHNVIWHDTQGCQQCDCRYIPSSIAERLKELAEESKPVRREIWAVTYDDSIILFLFEPSVADVLLAVDPKDKIRLTLLTSGCYKVTKTFAWEKPQ